MKRRILVTSALPYANGHIHIGHLVEYLQTDIWVRFQKLRGHDVTYICADDTHGTALMIRARSEGVKEEDILDRMLAAHLADFTGFGIEFENYGSTNCSEDRAFCHEIWAAFRKADLIEEKDIEQLYDVEAKTFIADRFVKGTCPKCGRKDQYGDNCECGAHYSPTELADPISTITGTVPEIRTAKHLFVNIDAEHAFLEKWVASDALQPEVSNYLLGQFLNEPLHPWDVSRPAPYFGFEIPDSPGNFWYVWFDAPIGYIASTKQWTDRTGRNFDDWWRNSQTEIHHFIGKDITYFHTLFWPTMLKTAGFTLPTKVHIHGFLTVNGEKMSKSKGTFVLASTYLKHIDPSYLRYFYASKLSNHLDDIDLNFEEIETKINADLVGNVVNLASRTAKFALHTGLSDYYPDDGGLFDEAAKVGDDIADAYEVGDFGRAMRLIMECGNRANKFVEDAAPWTIKLDPTRKNDLRDICTVGLNLFRQIVIYLSPVLPKLKTQVEELLHCEIRCWNDSKEKLLGGSVAPYRHLMTRVPKEGIAKMIEDSKDLAGTPGHLAGTPGHLAGTPGHLAGTSGHLADTPADDASETGVPAKWAEPLVEQKISIDDFTKIDLRIARIVEASEVKEAKKLLRLKLSLGGDEYRNVFAGIKSAYDPATLIDRLVVCVANLEPRQMKFGLSEGMVVAAGPGGEEIYLISPDDGAKPGMRLH